MEECEFAAKANVRFDRILKFRESFDTDHIQKSLQFVRRSIDVERYRLSKMNTLHLQAVHLKKRIISTMSFDRVYTENSRF